MKVVLASSNPGKLRELQTLLSNFKLQCIPQSELAVQDVPETGFTFVENALIKARHACRETGLPAIADDSGLAVQALQGAPGIYSARYAGPQCDAQANIEKLLLALKKVPGTERAAAFYSVVVYLAHENDPMPLICQGIWKGFILMQPQGNNGFGYDPIFGLPGENKSAAELSFDLKNSCSHRSQALRLLRAQLPEKWAEERL
jgi:XTP/dITP diphosphohydrolase